ncbi:MAG: DNA topoisomerase [Raoultibacter sp.]
MNVIYAEKPSLGRKIAEALGATRKGNGFMSGTGKTGVEIFVTWGFGHMGGLVYPEVYDPAYKSWRARPCPFIPEEYRIAPNIDRGVESQLAIIADVFKPENTLICATDDDREGELIFAYVCELVGYEGSYQRVKLDSLTTNGIRKAFGNLIDGAQRQNIVAAGRARSIADWVVGINLTCASTIHFMRGKSKTMSVGRVQTPTLAMIVERELAIQNFNSKPLFTPTATVTAPSGETYTAKSENGSTEDKQLANTILSHINACKLRVETLDTKEKKTNPPLLYSQTTLQMAGNKQLGYTAQQTLDFSQELYEKGFITYPRTSSQYLTSDMAPTVHKVLEILGRCERYKRFVAGASLDNFPASTCDDKKVESHFAIVPTGKIPQGVSAAAVDLYDLIAKSLIRLYYPPAIVEETTAIHLAIATPHCVLVQQGSIAVGASIINAAGEPERFVAKGIIIRSKGWWAVDAMPKREKDMLPAIDAGGTYPATFEVKKTETTPPKRFTDETLVSSMKAAGKSLEDDDYKEILSDPRHMGIGTDATRAGIIETLVARGFIERKKKQIHATPFGIQVIKTLPVDDLKSASLTAQWEQRLKAIENGEEELGSFVGDIENQTRAWCAQVKSSNAVIVNLKEPDPELEGAVCPLCGSPLRFTNAGIGCSAYVFTKCRYTLWSTIAQKKLTKNQLGTLATKGKTPVYKGFISKKGEKFDAGLVLDPKTGRVSFSFPPREG